MSAPPARITVLIPARNEAADLPTALAGVLAQDLPRDLVEVIVVDGGSTDDTGRVASEALQEQGLARVEVIRNEAGTTPSNLNVGLGAATGDVVCRVDARSIIPPDYVRRCLDVLEQRPEVAVVGGSQRAVARDDSAKAVGIARALNNRYGMGLARYRRGAPSGPTDTVYLGAFRTAQLRGAGGWDERFLTNQDYELNRRMGRIGVVWFESGLEVGYLPRRTIRELFWQYHRFGQWKVRYWRMTGERPQPRQLVLLGLPPAAAVGLATFLRHAACRVRRSSVAVGFVVLLAVEALGAGAPGGSPAVRAQALGALVAVAIGWTSGVWFEGLAGCYRRSLSRRVRTFAS